MSRIDSTMNTFSDAEIRFEAKNWRKAQDIFQNQRGHKDKKNMAEFLADQTTPKQAEASCLDAQKRAGNQYKPGLGAIFSKMEIFMKVGDLAIQSAPESVGLAWSGIRLCLHTFEDDFATFQIFSGAAADIIGILISCRVYGKMWGDSEGPEDSQELHAKVVEKIPDIYVNILEFSYAMKKHMKRNTGERFVRGLLTSQSARFKPMIDDIKGAEKTMSQYATKASEQLSKHYQETGLQMQGVGLQRQQAMMADLYVIKESLGSSLEINKVFAEQLRQQQEDMKDMRKKTPFEVQKGVFDEKMKNFPFTNVATSGLEKHRSRRAKDTCNWIFEIEEYRSWIISSESGILWVSGVGGLGKSILMASVIDGLQKTLKESGDEAVQYFFCSSADDSTRLSARIKSQILAQLYDLALSEGSADILKESNEVVSKFPTQESSSAGSQQKKPEKADNFEDIYSKLVRVLRKKVYLIIDALDECIDREESQILKSFQQAMSVADLTLKIMVCSRPETDITDSLSGCPTIKVEYHNGPDIERAAKAKLDSLPGLSTAERSLACKAIVEKAKGLFRCVDPAIEFLRKPWRRPLENRLEQLPDGLNNSYRQILSQTDAEYLGLLNVCLTWSIFGQSKPRVAEIMDDYSCAYAEGIEGSDDNPYDAMKDQFIADQIRAAGSSTFLEVTGEEVSVRHTTVKDFFLDSKRAIYLTNAHCVDDLCPNCKAKGLTVQNLVLTEKQGHLRMAITIFKHLNSPLFRRRYLRGSNGIAGQKDATKVESTPADGNVKAASPLNGTTLPTKMPDTATEEQTISKAAKSLEEPKGISNDGSLSVRDSGPDGKGINLEMSNGDPAGEVLEPLSKDEYVEQPSATPDKELDVSKQVLPDGTLPTLEKPEADPTDSDDDDDMWKAYEQQSDAEPEQEPTRPERYELSYWPDHLKEAENLWSLEEREASNEWKELYALVLKFLCDSSEPFNTWQQKYMALSWEYFIDDTRLSPLQVAAAYGLTGLAKKLIDRGESATSETEDGRSALWFAVKHDVKLLELLLNHGADPNSWKDMPPPFHMLLWLNPKLEHVKSMLEHHADCTMIDVWNLNGMHYFDYLKDVEVLNVLIEAGADINILDTNYGETPLHKLMHEKEFSVEILESFLQKGALVNKEDRESQMPLYEASQQGNTEAIRVLLDHGADLHHADIHGQTVLHVASLWGRTDSVRLLTDKGISLELQDKHGRTPFYLACSGGHLEIARFLMTTMRDRGLKDIHVTTKKGRSPLTEASSNGYYEIVKMILDEPEASLAINDVETKTKRTALHWAAYHSRPDVVDLLLQKGADATIRDHDGNTALALCAQHWALNTSYSEPIILALIQRDQPTAASDSNLMAAAAITGSTKVTEALLDAKAHPGQQDEHGWTPLQLARQYGHTDTANILARRGAEVGSRPSRWITEKEKIKVSEDGRGLEFIGKRLGPGEGISILANHPIPAGIERFYYEIEVKDHIGENQYPSLAIGFATQPANLDRMPGWYNVVAPSFAYHGDDGRLFANNNTYKDMKYAGVYGKGDTIGCGVIYNDSFEGTIFYTRDGEPQGPALDKDVKGRLYPVIGMQEQAAISVNFGGELDKRPFKWALGNHGKYGLDAVKAAKDAVEPAVVAVP